MLLEFINDYLFMTLSVKFIVTKINHHNDSGTAVATDQALAPLCNACLLLFKINRMVAAAAVWFLFAIKI